MKFNLLTALVAVTSAVKISEEAAQTPSEEKASYIKNMERNMYWNCKISPTSEITKKQFQECLAKTQKGGWDYMTREIEASKDPKDKKLN